MGLVQRLWDSWEHGALIGDQENARFADPDLVHAVEHQGEFYSVAGPLNVTRSPQGRPVLVQAGSSTHGREFAAAHAEAIYATQFDLDASGAFSREIRSKAAALGRDSNQIRILPGLVPIVADAERAARAKFDELQERLRPESAPVRQLASWLGYPDEEFDLDSPLPAHVLELPLGRVGPQGFFTSLTDYAAATRHTVRHLLTEVLGGHRVVIGDPVQVADHIETWWRSGSVDGFTIIPAALPRSLEDFVDLVVPVLQQRGIFRSEYSGITLRDHLDLREPENSFAELSGNYRGQAS